MHRRANVYTFASNVVPGTLDTPDTPRYGVYSSFYSLATRFTLRSRANFYTLPPTPPPYGMPIGLCRPRGVLRLAPSHMSKSRQCEFAYVVRVGERQRVCKFTPRRHPERGAETGDEDRSDDDALVTCECVDRIGWDSVPWGSDGRGRDSLVTSSEVIWGLRCVKRNVKFRTGHGSSTSAVARCPCAFFIRR